MKKFMKATIPAAIALGLVACGGGSSSSNDDIPENMARITLDSTNLEPLGDDFVYEGWLITPGGPVTAGRFDIDADGNPSPAFFDADLSLANAATTYVLTIEPAEEDEAGLLAPAATHILAGNIEGASADVTTSHGGAFGTDFADAAGTFIVATPTNGDADTADQGIWFLNPPVAPDGPTPSLTLPTLPEGWVYEGWVAGPAAGGPVSTGTFTSVSGADSDGAGPTAGTAAGAPPFPGQDFITPPLNIVGLDAVISVEPFPDNSPAPFIMKPLVGPVTTGSGTLANVAADTLPSGTVSIEF